MYDVQNGGVPITLVSLIYHHLRGRTLWAVTKLGGAPGCTRMGGCPSCLRGSDRTVFRAQHVWQKAILNLVQGTGGPVITPSLGFPHVKTQAFFQAWVRAPLEGMQLAVAVASK